MEQEASAETVVLERAEARERAAQNVKLSAALSDLDEEEKQLIQALFFDGIPGRRAAFRLRR